MHDYWTIYKYMDGFLCDDTDLRQLEDDLSTSLIAFRQNPDTGRYQKEIS